MESNKDFFRGSIVPSRSAAFGSSDGSVTWSRVDSIITASVFCLTVELCVCVCFFFGGGKFLVAWVF